MTKNKFSSILPSGRIRFSFWIILSFLGIVTIHGRRIYFDDASTPTPTYHYSNGNIDIGHETVSNYKYSYGEGEIEPASFSIPSDVVGDSNSECNFHKSIRKQNLCRFLRKPKELTEAQTQTQTVDYYYPPESEDHGHDHGRGMDYQFQYDTDLELNGGEHGHGFTRPEIYYFPNPNSESYWSKNKGDFIKPRFKETEFLWRKRMKPKPSRSRSLAFPITILGLPLLWTLVLSILIKDHLEESKEMNMKAENKMPMDMNPPFPMPPWLQNHTEMKNPHSRPRPPSTMMMRPRPEEEMSKESQNQKQDDIKNAADTIAFTKEIIKIATQSFNLASNTVELFNVLRGSNIDDGPGPGPGGGGVLNSNVNVGNSNTVVAANRNSNAISETETFSNVKLAGKFLQLSSTVIFLVIQFLGF